jgi:hypothetical protein
LPARHNGFRAVRSDYWLEREEMIGGKRQEIPACSVADKK